MNTKRPSGETRDALVRAGVGVIREHGFSGLTLRRVAARAGVNLGMFPYCFGSKRVFVALVAQGLYDEFFRGFSLATAGEGRPLDRLRRGLRAFARFTRDNRRFAASLAADLIAGHADAGRFLARNLPRHVLVLLALVRAAQRDGSLKRVPLPVAMAHLIGATAAPHLVAGAAEAGGGPAARWILRRVLAPRVLSDEAVALRVDLALKGLAP